MALAIIRSFGPKYMIVSIVGYFSELVVRLSQPFMVGMLTSYLTQVDKETTISTQTGVIVGVCFIISCFLYTASRHRSNVLMMRVGNNVRTALTVMLYKKVMRLSKSSMGGTDVGQIINVMANDLNR